MHWSTDQLISRGSFNQQNDDGVIKCKHSPRYWPFVRGNPGSLVNSPHRGQWRGILIFSLICSWINSYINNGETGDLRRHLAHYDITVIFYSYFEFNGKCVFQLFNNASVATKHRVHYFVISGCYSIDQWKMTFLLISIASEKWLEKRVPE